MHFICLPCSRTQCSQRMFFPDSQWCLHRVHFQSVPNMTWIRHCSSETPFPFRSLFVYALHVLFRLSYILHWLALHRPRWSRLSCWASEMCLFSVLGPALQNSLSPEILTALTLLAFRKVVETWLFSQALSPRCWQNGCWADIGFIGVLVQFIVLNRCFNVLCFYFVPFGRQVAIYSCSLMKYISSMENQESRQLKWTYRFIAGLRCLQESELMVKTNWQ